MKCRWKDLCALFRVFFKIGAFTFGGGYAMIPLIQREVAQNRGWVNEDEILEMLVIAESTPGPIAINVATFVGVRVGGFLGALFATFGIVLPSFIVISTIAAVLEQFQELRVVRYAFFGIRAAVLALILNALCTMLKKCPKNIFTLLIVSATFLAAGLFGWNVPIVMLICAMLGFLVSWISKRRAEK